MSERSGLDRLADLASRRPVASSVDPDAAIREALVTGHARLRRMENRRRAIAIASAATAIAAAAALAFWWRPPAAATLPRIPDRAPVAAPSIIAPAPAAPVPTTFALGEQHRVHAMAGARLTLEARDRTRTTMRLAEGAALFDVGSLNGGSFEVRTPDALVRVRGTVFAVTVAAGHTHVQVFEGRVEVHDGQGDRTLDAGEAYAGDPSLQTPGPLIERGAQVAREREAPAPARSNEAEPARRIDLAALRALCDRGEFAAALDAMRGITPPGAERGDWAMLEGDAQRALGRDAEAADAYERAAAILTPTRAALAGFLSSGSYERAGDLAHALGVLERTHAAERGSPLEERALAARASLLARLSRMAEARTAARAYLASFPGGAARAQMDALLE